MIRMLVGLVLGVTLAASWRAQAGEEPPPKKLTPEERKELQLRWKELTRAGEKLYEAGKRVEATRTLQEALEVARRLYPVTEFPDGHPDLAASLNTRGYLFQVQGKDAEAEPLFREALAMRRRLFPDQDHPDVAISLTNLAFLLKTRRQSAGAEPLFREALAMRRRLYADKDHPEVADSLTNLALVLKDRSRYAEAESLCREALAMRRRLFPDKDHPDLVESLGTLGALLKDQSLFADAEPPYREALEMNRRLYPGKDHVRLVSSLNTLAMVLQARGLADQAELLFREALEMTRRLFPRQDHARLATALNNLAAVLRERGKYADAVSLDQEALAMRRRLYSGKDHPSLTTSLNNLALGLRAQGKLANAEPLLREALDRDRRLYLNQGHPLLARSLNNLALVLKDQGRADDAEPLLREALATFRRVSANQDRVEVATSLNNLGAVLQDQGNHAEAEKLFREALAIRRRIYANQDHPLLARSLNNLAQVLQDQGNPEGALPLFRDALRMYRALARAYAASLSEGDALNLAASFPHTRDSFLSTARTLQTDPAEVYRELWASRALLTRVYEQKAFLARAASANPRAAELLAQLTALRCRRADLLLAPRPADPGTLQKRNDDLAELGRQIDRLDRTLRPLLPAVDRAEKRAQATPAQLQQALPADAAVVDFLRCTGFEHDPRKPDRNGAKGTARYLAFVLTSEKISWIELGPAQPIEEAISTWREAITRGKEIPVALTTRLRELLWAKVRREVPIGVKVVYVCPDLALCRVPWAALPGDRPGTILLEDHAVAVVPHVSFLLDRLWSPEALARRPTEALVVGGVAYDADLPAQVLKGGPLPLRELFLRPGQALAWAALPGAAAEAQGVVAMASRNKRQLRTLSGEKATAMALLAALPGARSAHLATHGFFADASFQFAFQIDPKLFEMTEGGERVGAAALSPLVMTGLVFAGANRPTTPGRGIVTGEALVDLDLSGLELAVLSACETGLGDVAGGEGTFGLQRAFHLAGTRDVVASLWKVPDRPTAALMALFYRNLWDRELPPIEALRQAQLEIYRHPEKIAKLAAGFRGKFEEVPGDGEAPLKVGANGKAHPQLWAAFTLSGPGR